MMGLLVAAAVIATPTARALAPLRIVALGTSLTASAIWPRTLENALARRGAPAAVTVVAKPGMTSDWGLAQLDRVVAVRPDIVLVEFAANDAALQRMIRLRHSRANMMAIVGGLRRRLPGVCVVVMAMNPMAGMRGWMRPWLDQFYDAHLRDAAAEGATTVDFRPDWRRLPEAERARIIADGAHPEARSAARLIVPRLIDHIDGLRCGRAAA